MGRVVLTTALSLGPHFFPYGHTCHYHHCLRNSRPGMAQSASQFHAISASAYVVGWAPAMLCQSGSNMHT